MRRCIRRLRGDQLAAGRRGSGLARGRPSRTLAAFSLLVVAGLVPGLPRVAADEVVEECLECHADMEGDRISFDDGSAIELGIDFSGWKQSVHGKELLCVGCHRQHGEPPHASVTAESAREYQLERSQSCKRCHYAYYTRVVDGIHYKQLQQGVREAPTCVDCHNPHDTARPGGPRLEIDRRCARCHSEVSTAYRRSVHGRALATEENADVPVCIDCHGAHAIRDPRDPSFRLSAHEICARCHGDADRMARYGLNPNVARSYLKDFHGISNRLYAGEDAAPRKDMATCTDCHGMHDIQSFDTSGGKEAVRERVSVLCQKCHPDATPAFGDAWLSHYEPSLAKTPLVFAVKWGYRILIPVIMAGLVLHILLHLWRMRSRG